MGLLGAGVSASTGWVYINLHLAQARRYELKLRLQLSHFFREIGLIHRKVTHGSSSKMNASDEFLELSLIIKRSLCHCHHPS